MPTDRCIPFFEKEDLFDQTVHSLMYENETPANDAFWAAASSTMLLESSVSFSDGSFKPLMSHLQLCGFLIPYAGGKLPLAFFMEYAII